MKVSFIPKLSPFFKGIPVTKIKNTKILSNSNHTLQQGCDGSYCVDEQTGTKMYYGADAAKYLDSKYIFGKNTEIIAQSKTKLRLFCKEGEYILDEPGAILIKKDTDCNVKVLEGSPLVVEYTNKPYWYSELKPDNEHSAFFARLAKRNHEIYICDKYKKISSYQNPGEVSEKDFYNCPYWVYPKLMDKRLLLSDDSGKVTWGGYWDNNNFQYDLYDQVGIYGDVKDRILDVWHKTTKSGYDISGLKKVFKGITIYTHKDKFNQFNNKPTEWITNSTAWTDSGPFMVGVSRFINLDSSFARDFNSVRPAEKIHRHRQINNPNNSLTEIYLLTQGNAIMYTIIGNKIRYNEIKEGEMAIIPPLVQHGITAISGEYEHLCTQTPSVFQYGFSFKNICRDFNPYEKRKAINKLKKLDEEM